MRACRSRPKRNKDKYTHNEIAFWLKFIFLTDKTNHWLIPRLKTSSRIRTWKFIRYWNIWFCKKTWFCYSNFWLWFLRLKYNYGFSSKNNLDKDWKYNNKKLRDSFTPEKWFDKTVFEWKLWLSWNNWLESTKA